MINYSNETTSVISNLIFARRTTVQNNDEHFRLEKSEGAHVSSKGIRFRALNHPAYLLADFLESRTLDTHGLETFPRLCSFIAAGDYGTKC